MTEPWQLDVNSCRRLLAAGSLGARELMQACLDRIASLEDRVHAWAFLDPVAALDEAGRDRAGPLSGVPFGIKDIFNTVDMPTGMGSPVWADFHAGNDARVVFYAREAGSVPLGKTVTAEFAVHTPGPTRNPHDLGRSPGTSSSGSAAAVSCGMVPWALGSQTAGSIIRPASYCGVFGYKPSYGLIPRTGMLKTSDTFDQVGFFCRSVDDLRLLLDVLRVKGSDYPLVHRTLDKEDSAAVSGSPRVGLLTTGMGAIWDESDVECRRALERYSRSIESAGFVVEEIQPPPILLEAHQTHATIYDRCIAYYFDTEAQQGTLVSDEIRSMVERGRRISLEEYTAALDQQVRIQDAFNRFLQSYDLLLTLSTSGIAPKYGDSDGVDSALIWTLCGAPSLSVPIFTSTQGMPFGAQFVAARFADYRLIELVRALDELTPTVLPVEPPREQAVLSRAAVV